MATSAARIRSLYRRHHQAQEAVYHFSACSPAGAAAVASLPRLHWQDTKLVRRRALPCGPSP